MEQKKQTNKKFALIIGSFILIGLIYGTYKIIHSLGHEETDDAQIEMNMSPIIPHVGGYIDKVFVADNEFVKKGDTLFIINDQDYVVQLEQAKAGLVAAESQLVVAQVSVGSYRANVQTSIAQVSSAQGSIENAKITLWRAENDFKRYENLYKNHSITTQQYEEALAAKQAAEQNLDILNSQQKASASKRKAASSQSEISVKQIEVAKAKVQSAQAQLDAALLNMGYTIVTAPIDGQLSKVDLQVGQFVQAGQSLFYLVDTKTRWVVANFKETQLEKMEIGQSVNIKVDAYPDETFQGKVTAFSPATGAKFSLLPPDNASGNFVKTIQRLPVKIDFAGNDDPTALKKLRSGMNAIVDVHLN